MGFPLTFHQKPPAFQQKWIRNSPDNKLGVIFYAVSAISRSLDNKCWSGPQFDCALPVDEYLIWILNMKLLFQKYNIFLYRLNWVNMGETRVAPEWKVKIWHLKNLPEKWKQVLLLFWFGIFDFIFSLSQQTNAFCVGIKRHNVYLMRNHLLSSPF